MGKVVRDVGNPMINTLSPYDRFRDALQYKVDSEFDLATDVKFIQEEIELGSGEFLDVRVRINHKINSETGKNIGSDFKGILFDDIGSKKKKGIKYRFDDNYWLTTYIDNYRYITPSVVARRCNNVLRWMDNETGELYEEPCIIDYEIKYDNGDFRKPISVPDGIIWVTCQGNIRTNKIGLNKRFLFGNDPQAWMVQSVNNFISDNTFEDNASVLEFSMMIDQKSNESQGNSDSTTNRIANFYSPEFKIVIDGDKEINLSVGSSGVLMSKVLRSGTEIDVETMWSSSDNSVVRIDSMGSFVVDGDGECILTCCHYKNRFVCDSVRVVASATSVPDSYMISVSPSTSYILQGRQVEFVVSEYKNGLIIDSEFEFSASGIPSKHYELVVVGGNNFIVKNILRYEHPLVVKCLSKESGSIMYKEIELGGLW